MVSSVARPESRMGVVFAWRFRELIVSVITALISPLSPLSRL